MNDLRAVLESRGIALAADEANWSPGSAFGQHGWLYPVYNSQGAAHKARRFKNADSGSTMKYAWSPEKPAHALYYLLPDTLEAIRSENGFCYLASGEPDVLAYRAAGIRNVISWFDGEKSVPETLVANLESLGVSTLLSFPDRDKTGMQATAAILLKLDSAIEFLAYALPSDIAVSHGYDVNQAWITSRFDRLRFKQLLMDAPLIDEDELRLYGHEDYVSQPALPMQIGNSELPPRFVDAVLRDVESRALPGKRFRWGGDGWSTNVRCIFHDDHLASAGFNRESMSFKCFVCGSKSAKEYGERVGLTLRDFYDTSLPSVHSNGNGSVAPSAAQDAIEPSAVIRIVDSHEAIQQVIEELEGDRIPTSEPLPFPFTIYHRFGGFAHYIWAGKMIYISSVSGGGKTAYLETIGNEFRKRGSDFMVFSPEWQPTEFVLRDLQRYKGMDTETISAMRVWRAEERRGIPKEKRNGQAPPQGAIEHSVEELRKIQRWAGRAHYVEPGTYDLNQLLDGIEQSIEQKRTAGRDIKAFFFDYLQRAPKSGKRDWDWGEVVAGRVKNLCERLNLFGFLIVQPNKGDSKATRTGDTLTEASGQGISDQQANLYITLTPIFDKVTGEQKPYTKVSVVKNSMGTKGFLWQESPLKYLTWLDREVHMQTIDLTTLTEEAKDTPF